mmetsp:Transcript_87322/g.243147  ORF Transcript_87322/g.243147 Transcript_87322/m.243147 type:complete len:353 (-) Transcript_87322:196-1254(-)
MGLCGSSMTADDKRSKEVEARNKADFEAEQSKIKLLLLGAGESGKSTIFKQMKILYGLGFSPEEQKQMTPVVYNNTIVSMKTLLQAAEDLTPPVAITAAETAKRVMEVSDDREIDAEVGGWIKELWADPGVTETYEQRSKFQLIDSAEYYFESIDRIMADDYTATVTDILKSRVRTSGIVEEKYKIDGVDFVMFDVGGQRNERRKWIHCFDDVKAIIFLCGLCEYNQVMYEDVNTNRMHESLNLYAEVCGNPLFKDTPIFLFLNKKDVFEEMIRVTSLSTCFPDFDAKENNALAATEFIKEQFRARHAEYLPEKPFYAQVLSARVRMDMKIAFGEVKETIKAIHSPKKKKRR